MRRYSYVVQGYRRAGIPSQMATGEVVVIVQGYRRGGIHSSGLQERWYSQSRATGEVEFTVQD